MDFDTILEYLSTAWEYAQTIFSYAGSLYESLSGSDILDSIVSLISGLVG